MAIRRIYADAEQATPQDANRGGDNDVVRKQGYLRRVSREFHRRLKAAGIYVEGAQ
jgi:hypothetical protein